MVIPKFFEQALNGEPITVFGSGEQTRDFTHIDETIKATVLLAEKSKGAEIFNIANETEKSIFELAKVIKEITNSKSEVKLVKSPKKRYDYEVERRVGSSNKLFNATGFKPSTDIQKGLNEYYISLN